MKQEEFNEIISTATKALSLEIIKIVSELKYSDAIGIIRKQLFKSVTSVAANFRAVCRARSDKERYSKLCIVVEEADETLLWIEMLIDGGFITVEKIENPQKEAEEILKVMAAFKKKLERTHQ
jgi:four helix bundle protein